MMTTVFLVTFLTPPFRLAQNQARAYSQEAAAYINGQALGSYLLRNNRILPPQTSASMIGRYLNPYREMYGEPAPDLPISSLIWCGAADHLRLSDVRRPDRFMIAYGSAIGGGRRAVLSADGFGRECEESDFREMMREQPALIAEAERARAKRLAHITPKPAVK